MQRYEEQLERVRRYKRRLERMYAGQPYRHEVAELHDDAYSFFVACYHLKDWLKQDPEYRRRPAAEIEAFVSDTPALALCADICNSIKHLELDRDPRSGSVPRLAGRHSIVDYGDDPAAVYESPDLPLVTIRAYLRHGGQVVDVLDLANEALAAWERFV